LWAIATLAGLVGLIILALCVPLDVALDLDTSAKPKFRLRLRWLFGLISKDIVRKKKEPEKPEKVVEKKPRKKRRIGSRTVFRILRTRGLLKQTRNLVTDVLGQLEIRDLTANLELGLEDPADTGLLFALIGSATPFINLFSRYQVRVQPTFYNEAVFEGYLHGILRLRPIKLVRPFLRFVFSLAALRVVKTVVLSRWKRKK